MVAGLDPALAMARTPQHLPIARRCTSRSESGRFQRWQQKLFDKAFTHWHDNHGNPPVDHAQFAAHFVR
jgi:hypothetical protein